MRIHIRPGPVLGGCGLVGMILIVGNCGRGAPDGPSTAFGEPVPLATPFGADAERPVPSHAVVTATTTTLPVTTAASAPTTIAPSPTSATVVPAAPPSTAPPAPPTAATTVAPATPAPAPAATPASPPPPDTIAVAAADPPVVAPPVPAPTPEPAPAPTEPAPESPPPSSVSGAVAIVNQERAAAGLPALAENGALVDAARVHSIDQASRQEMTHTGSDGSNAGDRIARAGFGASTWAENVAAGYPDSGAVMQGWMGSPDHRANILSADFTSIGVASAQAGDGTTYWTMVLAA